MNVVREGEEEPWREQTLPGWCQGFSLILASKNCLATDYLALVE
uniref:Uncharacterized protein n=1 Tax=Manihot esculenta TaxID=3983 RepID=A0A2C9VKF4_MANES